MTDRFARRRSSSTFRPRRTGPSSRSRRKTARPDGASARSTAGSRCWSPQAEMLAREAAGRELEDRARARAVRAAHRGGPRAHAVRERDRAGRRRSPRASPRSSPLLRCWTTARDRSRVCQHQSRRARAHAGGIRACRARCRGGGLPCGQAGALRRGDRGGRRASRRSKSARARVSIASIAVRDAVGADIDVMVDCHWRFDVARAEALLRDLESARPYWVECMTTEHPGGFDAIARLTALAHERGMRTAGGETIGGADAAPRDVRRQALRCAHARHQVLRRLPRHATRLRACAASTASTSRLTILPGRLRMPRASMRARRRPRSCGSSTSGTSRRCSIRWREPCRGSSTGRSRCRPDRGSARAWIAASRQRIRDRAGSQCQPRRTPRMKS